MSKFFQRYINSTKKTDAPVGTGKQQVTVDVTAPVTKMKSSAPGVANAGSRRVQIFTASESFTPGDSKPLVVFTKPEAAKGFLKGAISSHYLFEELGDDDLDRIIDCMRPSFAQANEV